MYRWTDLRSSENDSSKFRISSLLFTRNVRGILLYASCTLPSTRALQKDIRRWVQRFFQFFSPYKFFKKKENVYIRIFFCFTFLANGIQSDSWFLRFFYSYFKTRYVEYVVAQIVKNSVKCDKWDHFVQTKKKWISYLVGIEPIKNNCQFAILWE